MDVLTTSRLTKHYGSIKAVHELSFEVPEESIYGILGPNGSGKTTTLGILLGVINEDRGTFKWFGEEASSANRQQIGAILETPNFYPYLSGANNLKVTAKIKGVPFSDIDRVLKIAGLFERKNSKFKTYSLGMKQRLAIAAAMLGDPRVLVFDEPTNGLDPQGIAEVRETIIALGKSGKTILLASHMLDEVEKVCSHVGVLKNGELLASGAVDDILAQGNSVEIASDDLPLLEQILKQHPEIKSVKRAKTKVTIKLSDKTNTADLNKFLFEKGVTLSHLVEKKQTLESQFLELTK